VIRLTGHLICATAREADTIAQHLPDHLRLSRAETGCLQFDVHPTANPLIWQVEETFTDQAAFDLHQERTRASQWWTATAAIRREFTVLSV
jgi:quinol monooxygenase YgiN